MNIQAIEENRVWAWKFKKDQEKVREINDRLMMAERAFTDAEGLSGRSWYKHLVCLFLILSDITTAKSRWMEVILCTCADICTVKAR